MKGSQKRNSKQESGSRNRRRSMEKHWLLSFSLGLNSTSFLIPLRITVPGLGPFLIVKISNPRYLFLYSLRSVALHPHYKINLFATHNGYYRDPLLVKMQRIRNCQTQRYICNNPTLKLRGKKSHKRGWKCWLTGYSLLHSATLDMAERNILMKYEQYGCLDKTIIMKTLVDMSIWYGELPKYRIPRWRGRINTLRDEVSHRLPNFRWSSYLRHMYEEYKMESVDRVWVCICMCSHVRMCNFAMSL